MQKPQQQRYMMNSVMALIFSEDDKKRKSITTLVLEFSLRTGSQAELRACIDD
jgi:hypothetical protein